MLIKNTRSIEAATQRPFLWFERIKQEEIKIGGDRNEYFRAFCRVNMYMKIKEKISILSRTLIIFFWLPLIWMGGVKGKEKINRKMYFLFIRNY